MPSTNDKTLKRKMFCYFYLKYGNIYESALKAGFPANTAYYEGLHTLELPAHRRLIQNLSCTVKQNTSELVSTGLERLAFGNINDTAALLLSDDTPSASNLATLDLFNVSEIKRVKGGGLEVKFFDRQKALEKMFDFANSTNSNSSALSLIEALSSAQPTAEDNMKEVCDGIE